MNKTFFIQNYNSTRLKQFIYNNHQFFLFFFTPSYIRDIPFMRHPFQETSATQGVTHRTKQMPSTSGRNICKETGQWFPRCNWSNWLFLVSLVVHEGWTGTPCDRLGHCLIWQVHDSGYFARINVWECLTAVTYVCYNGSNCTYLSNQE